MNIHNRKKKASSYNCQNLHISLSYLYIYMILIIEICNIHFYYSKFKQTIKLKGIKGVTNKNY